MLGLILFGVGQACARRVNVNRFSLNGLYRNRLSRAFLGAAREDRKNTVDPFSGFDPEDNPRMASLRHPGQPPSPRLLHVVNVALNLVGGERLAWQERKAASFTITPLACGSAELSHKGRPSPDEPPKGAYIPTETYGGNEPDSSSKELGISLATAMTISGAAASPSMGYHTSPATSILMTLFNVRLGAWLPNPGCMLRPDVDMKARLQSSSPQNALRPLLGQLLGLTDASSDYVYLSDGGHFENLGIYEMIRRRCRFIVVSDAGCDPKCRFEDLGNAVRKVAIDLDGTMIDFTRFSIGPRGGSVQGQLAYALGTIRYPEGVEGRILYVKPSYFGDMPMDVRAYAEANAELPHQTTADQWFSESQFESYRRLGLHFVAALGKRSYGHLGRDAIRTFFDDLKSGATGASAATFTWRQPLQARAPGCGPNQGTR